MSTNLIPKGLKSSYKNINDNSNRGKSYENEKLDFMQLVIGFHSLLSLHSPVGMDKAGNSILGNGRKKESLASPILLLPNLLSHIKE